MPERAFKLIEHRTFDHQFEHELYRTPLILIDEGIVGDFARGVGRLGSDALRGTARFGAGLAGGAVRGAGQLGADAARGLGRAGLKTLGTVGSGLAKGAAELGRGVVGAQNPQNQPQSGMHRSGELLRKGAVGAASGAYNKLQQWRQNRQSGDAQAPAQAGTGQGEQTPPQAGTAQGAQPATQPSGSRLGRAVGAARRGAQWLAGRTPEQRQQSRDVRAAAHQAMSDFEAERGPGAASDPKHADEIQRRMALGVARATKGKVVLQGRKLQNLHKEIESSPRTASRRERVAREKADEEGFKKADEKVAAQLGHEKWQQDYLAGKTPQQQKKRADLEKQGREAMASAPADPLAAPEGGGPSPAQQARQKELKARKDLIRVKKAAEKVGAGKTVVAKPSAPGDSAAVAAQAAADAQADVEKQAAEKEAAQKQQHAAAREASAASPRGQKKAERQKAQTIEKAKRGFKAAGGMLPGQGEPTGKPLVSPGGAQLTGDRPKVEVPEKPKQETPKLVIPGQEKPAGGPQSLIMPAAGKLKLKQGSPAAAQPENAKPSVKGPAVKNVGGAPAGGGGGGSRGPSPDGQEGPGGIQQGRGIAQERDPEGKCPPGTRAGANKGACYPESLERGSLNLLKEQRRHLRLLQV